MDLCWFIDQVCHFIWTRFTMPQNNYNSNIKDYWWQIHHKICHNSKSLGLPWWLAGKESACQWQETWVQYLVWEVATCYVKQLNPCTIALEPVPRTWEPTCCNCWSPRTLGLELYTRRSHHNGKPPSATARDMPVQQHRPAQPKMKLKKTDVKKEFKISNLTPCLWVKMQPRGIK